MEKIKSLDSKLLDRILDYSIPLVQVDLDKIFSYFSVDLTSRKPSPALTETGEFQGTDFDLSSFLFALCRRGAVINIPKYNSKNAPSIKEGESLSSKENRHGKIISLYGNQETFSFGVRIFDMNVMKSDTVGDYRNFTLLDDTGAWYDGWSSIGWKPDAKENNFLMTNKLWTDRKVIFRYFVHPALRFSIFGLPYRIVKSLIMRCEAEKEQCNKIIKDLKAKGYKLPSTEVVEYPKTTTGESRSIKVNALQIELDISLINSNVNISYEPTDNGLLEVTNYRKFLIYQLKQQMNFIARSMELAYYKYNPKKLIPQKINNVWESDFKLPRKRISWDRLELQSNIFLRLREYEKSIRVKA